MSQGAVRGDCASDLQGALKVACVKPGGAMAAAQVWLQEFAWTEKDVQRKRQERSSSLPKESYEHFCMDCEPMFCFEVGGRQAATAW